MSEKMFVFNPLAIYREHLLSKSLWMRCSYRNDNKWEQGKRFDESKDVASFFVFPEKNQKAVTYIWPPHISWKAFTMSQHGSEPLLTIFIHRYWPITAKTDGVFGAFHVTLKVSKSTQLTFWKPIRFKGTELRWLPQVWSFKSTKGNSKSVISFKALGRTEDFKQYYIYIPTGLIWWSPMAQL